MVDGGRSQSVQTSTHPTELNVNPFIGIFKKKLHVIDEESLVFMRKKRIKYNGVEKAK
jgi:hypothetical protein